MNYIAMPGLKHKEIYSGRPSHTEEEVIAAVCKYFKIPQRVVFAKSRKSTTVVPRWICQYLLRTLCACRYEYMASIFHQNHTTILHSVRRMRELRAANDTVALEVDKIKELYL